MNKPEYIDFKLTITRPSSDPTGCQVALLPAPEVGETILPAVIPADKGPDLDMLPLITTKNITLRQLAAFGKGLANWLLPEGSVRELFHAAYTLAGTDRGVRLRLIIADHGLKELPWEYIYLNMLPGPDSMNGFLALNERISIVRHEPLPYPHPSPRSMGDKGAELKMVLASASPDARDQGLLPLDVDKEIGYIKSAVDGFDLEGVRIITDPVLTDVTEIQLRNALLEKAFIFHFAGHGLPRVKIDSLARDPAKEDVYLLLSKEDDKNKIDYLGAHALARLMQAADTQLAVLGACYSGRRYGRYPWDGVAGALAAAEIPVIISMQYEVIDQFAIEFSRAFYAALGLGLSLDKAMWIGRVAMLQETSDIDLAVNLEWGVPVLYSRLSDGLLFPERTEQMAESAETFKHAISQTVAGIMAGEMSGVKVKLLKDNIEIVQKVKDLSGIVTGAVVGGTETGVRISISQEVETVSGAVTGAEVNDTGGGAITIDQDIDTVEEDGSVTGLILD